MKLKVIIVDLEVPPRVKKWGLRLGMPLAMLLGGSAVAYAAGIVTWNDGQKLTAADLNNNFSQLQSEIAALQDAGTRQIARAHGIGPIENTTTTGALASRFLQYTKMQAATGLRLTWDDNLRCTGAGTSCEWEIKVDGSSCTNPGPLKFDVYVSDSAGNSLNIHRPEALIATCFGIAPGPHTIQIYVTAPASFPDGGTGVGTAGVQYTGFNAEYWSLEVEEVY